MTQLSSVVLLAAAATSSLGRRKAAAAPFVTRPPGGSTASGWCHGRLFSPPLYYRLSLCLFLSLSLLPLVSSLSCLPSLLCSSCPVLGGGTRLRSRSQQQQPGLHSRAGWRALLPCQFRQQHAQPTGLCGCCRVSGHVSGCAVSLVQGASLSRVVALRSVATRRPTRRCRLPSSIRGSRAGWSTAIQWQRTEPPGSEQAAGRA